MFVNINILKWNDIIIKILANIIVIRLNYRASFEKETARC